MPHTLTRRYKYVIIGVYLGTSRIFMSKENIERHNQICLMSEVLIDFNDKKVCNLYQFLSPMVGYRATILLLCLEQKRSVSTEEVKFIGEILSSLSNKRSFNVPLLVEHPLNFTLVSQLNSYETRLGNTYFISATPQSKWNKNLLDDTRKSYEIDLLLELYFMSGDSKNIIAKAALEYDGPYHLQETNVRKDKFRDSQIQADDIPVFRLPSQNTHFTPQQGRDEFRARLDIYKENVNDFIQKRINDYESHILNDRNYSVTNEKNTISLGSGTNHKYL